MSTYGESWGAGTWTVDPLLDAAVIGTGAGADGTAVSNDGKLDTEVSVEVAYGATYTGDVVLYFARETGGASNGGYEDTTTAAGYAIPGAASTVRSRTFTVPASIARFRPHVDNPSGADVTVTVRTRQSTGTSA